MAAGYDKFYIPASFHSKTNSSSIRKERLSGWKPAK